MFEILPESTDCNIGIKVSGKLTSEDYDVLLPKLDEAIGVHGKINLLMVLKVEKAAFVGDKKWQGWMVKILDPFTRHTKERFFEVDQLEDAWSWIKEE
jgi:hypothetical protein